MQTQTEENYLKCIYKLNLASGEGVTTNEVAAAMNTKAATVTDMLRKLAAKNMVRYRKYYGVMMTAKGKKAALNIIRRHRLWEVFLAQTLKFRWDEVHPIAEQLEHIRSDELIRKLDKFLGFPKLDPHGDPIPDTKGNIPSQGVLGLDTLKKNKTAMICGVTEHAPPFLRYLEKNQLMPGIKIRVEHIYEFDRSLDVKVNNSKRAHISHEVSKNILVRYAK